MRIQSRKIIGCWLWPMALVDGLTKALMQVFIAEHFAETWWLLIKRGRMGMILYNY